MDHVNFASNEFWCECRWCCDCCPKSVVRYLRVSVAPSPAACSTLRQSQLFQLFRKTVWRPAARAAFPNRNMFWLPWMQAVDWRQPRDRWQTHVIWKSDRTIIMSTCIFTAFLPSTSSQWNARATYLSGNISLIIMFGTDDTPMLVQNCIIKNNAIAM